MAGEYESRRNRSRAFSALHASRIVVSFWRVTNVSPLIETYTGDGVDDIGTLLQVESETERITLGLVGEYGTLSGLASCPNSGLLPGQLAGSHRELKRSN